MRAVLANRGLRRLLTSALATAVADWGLFVALGLYAYREGGAGLVAVFAAAQAAPAVVAAPAATALLSDRLSRKRLVVVNHLVRCVLLAAIALTVAAGIAVWWVAVIVTVHSAVSAVNQPARAALIPVLARDHDELGDQRAAEHCQQRGFSRGIGSRRPARGRHRSADGVQPVRSGLSRGRRRRRDHPRGGRVVAPPYAAGSRHRALGRARHRRDAPLRAVFVLIAALSVADGVIAVLVIVTPIQTFGMGASGVGYLNLACGAGGLATAAVALGLARRVDGSRALLAGSLVLGLPLLLAAIAPQPALAIVAWGCVGLGYSLVKSTGLALVQRLTPDASLLRVLGALEAVFVGCLGLGALITPVLIALAGLEGPSWPLGSCCRSSS